MGTRVLGRLAAAMFGLVGLASVAAADACPPLLDHQFTRLQDGAPMNLCNYAGKVILVVNTASFCGFTKQYDGLEKLYAEYKDAGLVVVGFPSNDFGEQEPGSDKEIADFCRLTYGIEFPMATKTVVKGDAAHPFYKQLAKASGSTPKWNFHKYLISRDASQVEAFTSMTKPESSSLRKKIDQFLAAQPAASAIPTGAAQ